MMWVRAAIGAKSHSQKTMRDRQKFVEAIVMHPMPSLIYCNRFRILEGLDSPIFDPIACPRFGAANQQRRTRDAPPYFPRVAIIEHVRRGRVNIVVELPRVGAVLVAANSPNREMTRLLAAQMRIRFDHARQRF